MGSQRQDHFRDLEQRKDREGGVHTTYTTRSQSRGGSRISHEKNAKDMQLEIDHLKRKLCHKRRRQTPSIFDFSSKSLGNDAMSRAFNQIFRLPFTCRIEGGRFLWQFTQPTFTMYNGCTDPVEHVSHFNQRMNVHSKNETLMCKVFLSSLGSVAMRWFDGLCASSINSFKELTRAFGSHFITCSRVPRLLDSLLSMSMREGKTLKTCSDKYREMFNEIDRDFDDVAIRNFKVGLPTEHNLRKSLTKKLVRNVRRLMDHIDEYKRVEEDQQQGKGKGKVIP